MTPFFTPLRIVLLLALAAAIVAGFVVVPAGAMLPIHWNVLGEVDATAPREVALLLPLGLVVFIWLVFWLIAKFASPAQLQAGRHVTSVAITLVIGMALVVELLILAVGLGQPVNVLQVIALALAVLLIVLGNALPKSQPNAFAGIRIPSTLRDPGNWQATHRLGGVLSILGGVVLIAAALLAPQPYLVAWMLACVFVPMLIATIYSMLRRSS